MIRAGVGAAGLYGVEAEVREFQFIAANRRESAGGVGPVHPRDVTMFDCNYHFSDAAAKPAKLRIVMLGEQMKIHLPFSLPALPLDALMVEEPRLR